MINHLTPQELREAIQDIASRVNDPALKAYYVPVNERQALVDELAVFEAHDDLVFLLDLIDALSPECFELTAAGKQALGGEQ